MTDLSHGLNSFGLMVRAQRDKGIVARRRILEIIDATGSSDAIALAAALGVHEVTVRMHLARLVARGHLVAIPQPRRGQGAAPHLYARPLAVAA